MYVLGCGLLGAVLHQAIPTGCAEDSSTVPIHSTTQSNSYISFCAICLTIPINNLI